MARVSPDPRGRRADPLPLARCRWLDRHRSLRRLWKCPPQRRPCRNSHCACRVLFLFFYSGALLLTYPCWSSRRPGSSSERCGCRRGACGCSKDVAELTPTSPSPRLINVTQALGEMAIIYPVSGGASDTQPLPAARAPSPETDRTAPHPSVRFLHALRALRRPLVRLRHGLELRPAVGRRPAPRDHRRRHHRQLLEQRPARRRLDHRAPCLPHPLPPCLTPPSLTPLCPLLPTSQIFWAVIMVIAVFGTIGFAEEECVCHPFLSILREPNSDRRLSLAGSSRPASSSPSPSCSSSSASSASAAAVPPRASTEPTLAAGCTFPRFLGSHHPWSRHR